MTFQEAQRAARRGGHRLVDAGRRAWEWISKGHYAGLAVAQNNKGADQREQGPCARLSSVLTA
jgi:hypothetical protein